MRRGGLVLGIRRPRLILLRFKAAAEAAVVEAVVAIVGLLGLGQVAQAGATLSYNEWGRAWR